MSVNNVLQVPGSRQRTAALFLSVVAALLVGLATAGQSEGRIKGWQNDIDSLLSLMKGHHYVYKTKPLPEELVAKATGLKTRIGQYSDERMLLELERLAYYMHDGHSYVLPIARNFASFYLPVQFYLFSDGVFIIDADDPYKALIGNKVISIGDIPIEKLIADMAHYVHQDNQFTVRWFAPTILRFRGLYESYGLGAGSPAVKLKLADDAKTITTREMAFVAANGFRGIPKLGSSLIAKNKPAPLYLSKVSDNFWFQKLAGNQGIYFQFNQVENKAGETIERFSQRLDSALQVNKPRLFVIDVRNNNGGNADYLPPLIDVIQRFKKINPKSNLVVITGRNTFSAAQIFISLLDKETHAIFAGEPSSSKPNFVGEEDNMFLLPYSGAMGNISGKYHETIKGDRRQWIQPEMLVNLSAADYFQNEDPVLRAVLRKFFRK